MRKELERTKTELSYTKKLLAVHEYYTKLKNYFDNHPQEKLIYFQDRVCSDEHIVYENDEHTKYHIEKI